MYLEQNSKRPGNTGLKQKHTGRNFNDGLVTPLITAIVNLAGRWRIQPFKLLTDRLSFNGVRRAIAVLENDEIIKCPGYS